MSQESLPKEEAPVQEEKNQEEKSFAELFNENESTGEKLTPGEKVTAEVVRLSKEWVFLDLGGKSEGALAVAEVVDDEGNPTVKEGDRMEVYFLGVERNEKIFTIKIGGIAAKAHLEEAFHGGIPVQGTVQKEIKGGFEVKIAGNVRAFCPYSQVSLRRAADPSVFIGQELAFKIIEYRENGRNIIVSHRKILEEERAEQRASLEQTLEIGQVVQGTITSVRKFGAFVDIGGVEGLIPISEISWDHITDIHSRVEEGQMVEVTVKKLDWQNDRFSFSLKDTLPDPWSTCTLQEGTVVTGTVARLADFGAFVTLAPGIDGLLHISNLGGGRRINHPREVVREGESVEVRIDAIDSEQKRISLALAQPVEEEAETRKKRGRKDKKDGNELREEFQRFQEKRGSGGKTTSMGTLGDLLKKKLED